MTKQDFHDLKDNEIILKVKKTELQQIIQAVEYVQRISLIRIEDAHIENPGYEYKDELSQVLKANYQKWCDLQAALENAEL